MIGFRLRGGPGTFGGNPDSSPHFFQESLQQDLNRKLVEYLRLSRKRLPDIDPKCLAVEDLEQARGEREISKPDLPQKLTMHFVKVVELLGESSGILQDISEANWKCFFTSRHALLPDRKCLSEVMPPGKIVQANASLIDPSRHIQYLASLVWPKDGLSSEDVMGRDLTIDQALIKKYYDFNDLNDMDTDFGRSDTNASTSVIASQRSDKEDMPGAYKFQEGTVFRSLDKNYGIVQVDKNFVLFDVCDFWMDKDRTASTAGKALNEILKTGSIVMFHASLINQHCRIPYLASSVWYKDAIPRAACPVPIVRENVHRQKIDIYKTVVRSVSNSLPKLQKIMSTLRVDRSETSVPSNQENYPYSKTRPAKQGKITLLAYVGKVCDAGILLLDQRICCFFLAENCRNFKECLKVGQAVYCNAKRIVGSKATWINKISHVAIVVTPSEDNCLLEPRVSENETIKKLDEIIKIYPKLLNDPIRPAVPTINLPLRRKAENQSSPDVESYGYFKCMFDQSSGLLEDHTKKGTFIYFEVSDVNVKKGDIALIDLVSLLNKMPGIEVRYQADKIEGDGPIQYVVRDRGVHISGDLPHALATYVMQIDMPESVVINEDKRRRFREAEVKFSKREYQTWSDLRNKQRNERKLSIPKPDVLKEHRGKIQFVLNENFGLIYEDQFHTYCLFDTYDLRVGNSRTAAEDGLTMDRVAALGDSVEYNACLVHTSDEPDTSTVPYLATAVWKPRVIQSGSIEALDKNSIQPEKINIYKQVC